MAEYDNVEMLGDTSLFLDEEPVRQQALAQRVRQNPALVTPSSGVQTPKPKVARPATQSPAAAAGLPSQTDLLRQIVEGMDKRPDPAQYQQHAQRRGQESDRNFVLGMTMQALGGEAFARPGAQLMAQSAKDAGDYEIPGGWGQVTRDGEVIWNPAKEQEVKQSRLTKLYEIGALDERQRELAEYRRSSEAAARQAREDARKAREGESEERAREKRTDTVRREYNARRDKVVQGSAFADSVVQQLADPNISKSAPGQVALVMQFGKMLDPDSVVREAEQRMIAQARGWFDSLMMTPDKIMSGQFLTPQQLQQMRQIAVMYQQGYGSRVNDLNDFYEQLAKRNKLPIEDIVQGGGLRRSTDQGRAIDAGARLSGGGGGGQGDSNRTRVDY
jgi:hypothetical protein